MMESRIDFKINTPTSYCDRKLIHSFNSRETMFVGSV